MPSVPTDRPVIAPRALALVERVGGQRLLRELVELYAAYAPTRIAEADAAAARGDADGVRRACHALKSGSAQLGATAVAERCATLEALAASGEIAGTSELVAETATALEEALAQLAAHVASGDAP